MDTVLELADVSVRRGQATLLDGVSWTVREGDRWVILGANGAGKTTLVQVCSAQVHPTAGRVTILNLRFQPTMLPGGRRSDDA